MHSCNCSKALQHICYTNYKSSKKTPSNPIPPSHARMESNQEISLIDLIDFFKKQQQPQERFRLLSRRKIAGIFKKSP